MSKVAFCPGKIIHTNEFYVVQENGEKKLISYFEAVEELEKSITSLRQEIELKKESKSKLKLKEETNSNISQIHPSIIPTSLQNQNKINQIENKSQSQNQINENKNKKELKNEEEKESLFGAVEIRETYDCSGNVVESQVVDLSSQFNTTQSLLSELDKGESKISLDKMLNKLQDRLNFPTQSTSGNNEIFEDVILIILIYLFIILFY